MLENKIPWKTIKYSAQGDKELTPKKTEKRKYKEHTSNENFKIYSTEKINKNLDSLKKLRKKS